MMQGATEQATGNFSNTRSKSTRFGDRMQLQNQAPSRPLVNDKQYRLRANSIREVLNNRNPNQETLEFEAKTPIVWDQFRQEPMLAIPTFGNWKKENMAYAIDTELYAADYLANPREALGLGTVTIPNEPSPSQNIHASRVTASYFRNFVPTNCLFMEVQVSSNMLCR